MPQGTALQTPPHSRLPLLPSTWLYICLPHGSATGPSVCADPTQNGFHSPRCNYLRLRQLVNLGGRTTASRTLQTPLPESGLLQIRGMELSAQTLPNPRLRDQLADPFRPLSQVRNAGLGCGSGKQTQIPQSRPIPETSRGENRLGLAQETAPRYWIHGSGRGPKTSKGEPPHGSRSI